MIDVGGIMYISIPTNVADNRDANGHVGGAGGGGG